VINARSGWLLWLGAGVGLWTVGSFIETIRDIVRRAHKTEFSRPFWHYRLASVALIIATVVLAMLAFSAQVLLTATEQFIYRLVPFAQDWLEWVRIGQILPFAILYFALWGLFFSVTPSRYRYSTCPKWPGALVTALWWFAVTAILVVMT
jgi:membrane protein